MKLGVLGLNPDNGHPFSFSAIINGYSDSGFEKSGWPVIHRYLRAKDRADFGFPGVRVTHAWTQDGVATRTLCEASLIEHAVAAPEDMIGVVDAVLLCRHDYETHYALARPFLEAGVPLFVDKPLSLAVADLQAFRPYLESGRVMSCSAMLYARELDDLRANLQEYGPLRVVRAAVVLDWAKYGVHMIDAVLSLGYARPLSVMALPAAHESFAVEMDDGSLFQVDALGEARQTLRLSVIGARRESTHQLRDNFAAFRRCLAHFIRMVETGEPQRDPELTLTSMRVLIAGLRSRTTRGPVLLRDVVL